MMDLSADMVIDLPGEWGRLRRCRHGVFLYNHNDFYIGGSLEAYGEFSEPEVSLLRSLVRPGDVVVDAGANIGTIAVPLAQKIGAQGMVYAFEPQRLNFQMLCANAALNGLLNVSARNAGLSDAEGRMQAQTYNPLTRNNCGDMRLSNAPAPDCEEVSVTTIDALNLARCRLIKIDVQGMEPRVLAGAAATIARCRPAMLVENDIREDSPALIRQIWGLDYRIWWHLSPLFVPNNFRGCGEDLFGHVVSSNLLCLPKEGKLSIGGEEVLDENFWPLG